MQIFNQETELEDSTHETRLLKKNKNPTYLVGKEKRNKAVSKPAYISSALISFFNFSVHKDTKYLHQKERKYVEVSWCHLFILVHEWIS